MKDIAAKGMSTRSAVGPQASCKAFCAPPVWCGVIAVDRCPSRQQHPALVVNGLVVEKCLHGASSRPLSFQCKAVGLGFMV